MSKQIESIHGAIPMSNAKNGHAPRPERLIRPWVRKVARTTAIVYCMQSFALLFPAHAQSIVPSGGAPAGQKAMMDAANNGVPIALIAPPSAAGVSRNQYDQFNVNPNGLILNNSRNNVQTQLGGWVAGNPQLGTTPARIILNEVVSGNASQLRGTMEVAGQRADIVIANPNGISCNGCGFLNADRATLTTGVPQFGPNGNLNGFDVRQGQLHIGAQGLNAANLEQLDLVARGLVIEGEVWAQNLNAIAGTNQVLYGTLHAVAQGSAGKAPAFAVDIKNIGGMYANQIYLIATEQGLGVNSQGRLAALQGNLVLSTNGDLVLKDSYAKSDVRLESNGNTVLNGQTVSDDGKTTIASKGMLTQQGEIDSQQRLAITAAGLSNTGTVTQRTGAGANFDVTGAFRNAGTIFSGGSLDVSAAHIVDAGGEMLAAENMALRAKSISLQQSELRANGDINLTATAGDLTSTAAKLGATGNLKVTARDQISNQQGEWQTEKTAFLSSAGMNNDGGTILAGGALGLVLKGNGNAGKLSNASGTLVGDHSLSIEAREVINAKGTLASGGVVSLDTHGSRLDNSLGKIVAGKEAVLRTGTLVNVDGTIASLESTLSIDTDDKELSNDHGRLQASGNISLQAADSSNRGGVISGHDLLLQTGAFDNRRGQIVADGAMDARTGTFDNRSGYLGSEGMQTLVVLGKIDNRVDAEAGEQSGGRIVSNQGLVLTAGEIINTDGEIGSEGSVEIRAQSLISQGDGMIVSGKEIGIDLQTAFGNAGIVSADESISIRAATVSNDVAGLIVSGQALSVTADGDYRNSGTISAAERLTLSARDIVNEAGSVTASGGETHILAAGRHRNAGMVSANGELIFGARVFENESTGVVVSGDELVATTEEGLVNAGIVSAAGNLSLTASSFAGETGSAVASGANVQIVSASDLRSAGNVSAAGNLTLGAKNIRNENSGVIAAGKDLVLLADVAYRNSGAVSAMEKLSIAASSFLNEEGGLIVAGDDMQLVAEGSYRNGGTLSSAGKLSVNAAADLINERTGIIAADGDLEMNVKDYRNAGAVLASQKMLLAADAFLNEADAEMVSGHDMTITANGAYRNAGSMLTAEKLSLRAASVVNEQGGVIAAGENLLGATSGQHLNAGEISAVGNMDLSASRISNATGSVIAAGGNMAIDAQGEYRNAGTFSAGETLSIDSDSFINEQSGVIAAGGDILAVADNDHRNAGTVSAAENLSIDADNVFNTASGKLAAGKDLKILSDGIYRNEGIASAARDVTLHANHIENNGVLSAASILTADVTNLTNNGEIGAGTTVLNVVGNLTNGANALIDGVVTDIRAGTTNNTGRIYGDFLTLQSQTLNNKTTGVIAARDTLFIGGRSINNTDGALIYSMGDLYMAGALNGAQQATGEVQQLLNASSTIEAGRNMQLAVKNLTNRNDGLTTRTETRVVPVNKLYIQPDGSTVKYDVAILGWDPSWKKRNGRYVLPSETYPFETYGAVPKLPVTSDECDSDGNCRAVRNYSPSDPVWQLFNVALDLSDLDLTMPDPWGGCMTGDDSGSFRNLYGACGNYWVAFDIAEQRINVASGQLNVAINAFNTDVKNRSFEAWNEYSINSQTIEETVLASTSPAKILAGNALSITGSGAVVNDNSNIVAGGAIDINVASLINHSTEGTRKITETGAVRHRRIEHHGGWNTSYETQYTGWSATTGAPVVSTFDLNAYVFQQNTAVAMTPGPSAANFYGQVPLAAIKSVESVVSPNINVTAVTVPNGVLQNVGAPVSDATTGGRITAALPASDVLTRAAQTVMPRLDVPGGSFFVIHPQPQASYLVETDPRFTQERNFLSSDYYLSQLNRDPERQLKRYGDGFIEQKLINDQILALTGRRYLSGYESTEAEYKGLMDAGIAFANEYQISPGVALSAEQMALLTTDIVLLVAQTVTLPDGTTEEVLVPQVYLRRPQAGDLAPSGALIAGSDILIKTQGDLVNSGQIAANMQAVLLAGNDLVNQGGRINAQDIVARAQNDLRNVSGVIQGTGEGSSVALSAGRDIILETRTIASQSVASALTASSSRISVDRIATVQGGNVSIDAGRDLVGTGSAVRADQDLIVTAERDIKISAVEGSYQLDVATGGTLKGRTGFVREQSVTNQLATMEAGNDLALVAGAGDVHLKGVDVAVGSSALIQGTNVTVEAAKDSRTDDVQFVNKSGYWHAMQADEGLAGGVITAGNALSVIATGVRDENGSPQTGTGNVRLSGAYLSTEEGQLAVVANNDVRIDAITTEHKSVNESYYKIKGMLGSRSEERSSFTDSQQVNGSVLSGDSVLIKAGSQTSQTGDVTIQASQVVAGNDLQIHAGRDLTIEQAQETSETRSSYEKRVSGMFSDGGLSVTFGKQQANQNHEGQRTSNVGSIVGSLTGDVTLTAGNQYTQTASQVTALEGDIDIIARKVDINAATDTYTDTSEQRFKQSGLTLAITSPVISAIQTVQQLTELSSKTKDGRVKALTGLGTALSVNNAYDAVRAGQGTRINGKDNQIATTDANGKASSRDATAADKAGGISLSISIGGSKSESKTTQSGTQAVGSTVTAGGDVRIVASGGGENSNVTVQGSDIVAGSNLLIAAENKINLLAAQNTDEQHSNNKSSSGSLGISIGTNTGITASASTGRGNADGTDTTWTNTHVDAGNQLTLMSGGDTNMIGAVASGKQVIADVGGDLNIQSMQNVGQYESKQKDIGGSITIGWNLAMAGSINYSKSNAHSDYASVTEQSGIKSGDGGFQIRTQGNTDLKGAVIASTENAVRDAKNVLVTGSLTTSDIANHAEASASSSGINLSSDMAKQGAYGIAKGVIGTLMNNSDAEGSASGTTRSAVEAGLVVLTDEAAQLKLMGNTVEETVANLNRDTTNAHNAVQKIDVAAMKETVEAERAIKQEFYKQATVITDAVYRSATGPKKIMLQKCNAQGAGCESVEVDLSTHKLVIGEDGKAYIFNHGILNTEEEALHNAAKQHDATALEQGVYVVINPHTGSALAEIVYAGWDKVGAPTFGISNASEANIDLREQIKAAGGVIVEVDHSRGNITSYNATQAQIERGQQNVPISTVQMNGSPVNAWAAQQALNVATGDAAKVFQSTHKNDWVSTSLGGNPATGGLTSRFMDAHTTYGPNVPIEASKPIWGDGVKSISFPVFNLP